MYHSLALCFILMMAEGEKLENPFAKGAGAGGSNSDRDGFLAFSSSTPRGSPSGGGPRGFRPKWGKANRQDNWRRFGQYNDQQEQQQMNMSAPNGEISSSSPHSLLSLELFINKT